MYDSLEIISFNVLSHYTWETILLIIIFLLLLRNAHIKEILKCAVQIVEYF